jgi:hypothetical protein
MVITNNIFLKRQKEQKEKQVAKKAIEIVATSIRTTQRLVERRVKA